MNQMTKTELKGERTEIGLQMSAYVALCLLDV